MKELDVASETPPRGGIGQGLLLLVLATAVGIVAVPGCDVDDRREADGDGDVDGDTDGDGDTDVPACPDEICSPDEDTETCPEDCSVCPDGLCMGDENAGTCPEDCPTRCGDGACTHDEDACSCEDDCVPVCDDGCCTHGETARSCYQDCGGCGDERCTPGEEDAFSCPEDCPARCGDGLVSGDEECDDGNMVGGDGCNFDCRFSCHGPEDCPDENDCTADVCIEVAGGWACDHEPVSEGASCEDGRWCNGDDTCNEAGECALHVGDPCTEIATVCNESEDRCEPIEPGEVIDGEEVRVELEGSVQKGPFVIGSSIAVALLDRDLDTTGSVHTTETINNRGEFELGFTTSGPMALEGDGYFYNEVTGALSASTLRLRALYGPTEGGVQPANLNVVTHLTTHRIRALVSDGWPFDAAVVRAERELIPALNITSPSFVPYAEGVEMSILGGDTEANAFLLAVGSVLIQVARNRRGSLEANLQEVLNTYALDLADGSLEDEAVEEVGWALRDVSTAGIERRLAERLAVIGSTAEVPDLDRVLDQDRDGYANADDCEPLDPSIHPGAVERCNEIDDDCDGVIEEDVDGDGYPDARCGGDDCDDADPGVNPGMTEICGNGVDEDCSRAANDLDCDGFDALEIGGYDCDDGNPAVHPGVIDVCGDGADPDCNDSDTISCFVTITAGTFTMGSPEDEHCYTSWNYCTGEGPFENCEPEGQRVVTLTHDFEMLNTEVTQAQFEGVMGYNHSRFPDHPDRPVDSVNWHEAAAYCNELSESAGLGICYDCSEVYSEVRCDSAAAYATPYDCPGYRLPTGAEWEFAARAGTTTSTYNGESYAEPPCSYDPHCDWGMGSECPCISNAVLEPIAWYCGNSDSHTHAVGTRAPNGWGLYDMLGNVAEWCQEHGSRSSTCDPWYRCDDYGVVRGGGYREGSWPLRAAYRGAADSERGGHGFRVVRTLDP